MKTQTLSIILALVGIVFVIWFNFQTSELFIKELHKMHPNSDLSPTLVSNGIMHKLSAIAIGIIGIFFGFRSIWKKKWWGILGIILSLILIFLAWIPLWVYMVSDTVDINIHY